MRKSHIFAACCCLGAALSALLPWGVLLWGESLVGKSFSLPAITYRLPEEPSVDCTDLKRVLLLLEKGVKTSVSSMEIGAAEMDAFALVDTLRDEVDCLQAQGVLSGESLFFTQSTALVRWSLPEGGQADLWEFTLLSEGETALLHYYPATGRVLSIQRTLRTGVPDGLAERALEGWRGYAKASALPGTPRVQAEGTTLFFSISPP